MRAPLHGRIRSLILVGIIAAAACCAAPKTALAETEYTIKGGGWGHGIGLSQYGARGYALKGWTYDRIVKYYYQGTKLVAKPTQKVKVNIDAANGSRSQWWIKAGGSTALSVKLAADTANKIVLDATKTYWITTSGGKTRVHSDKVTGTRHEPGTILRTFSGECYATAGGLVKVVGTSGPYSHSGVIWRGTIHFRPTSTTSNTSRAINYVDLEQYLYGVVPRESPASWPAAALQAQAVAARSYAYQDAVNGSILHCTTYSQVYNGYKGPKGGESASTNAAVDKTKGIVVWYGTETKPVKTYFSSSSGGHTASIQDVWVGSVPKPYYKGVVDADQDNPYYSWTSGPISASSLAGKIRDKDNGSSNTDPLNYSVASPATVTGIAVEKASSGHARYLNLSWSNGATYRISGDTFRSALGLKSTHFSVTSNVVASRYSDTNSKLAWTGLWRTSTNAAYYGGSMRWSSTAGSKVKASFTGSAIGWVASKGPGSGKADVYVDGKLVKTVDLYAAKTSYKSTVFSKSGLGSGTHSIEIRVLGAKNAKSTASGVGVDSFLVTGGAMSATTAPVTRYQQENSKNATLGSWTTVSGASYSGGSAIRTAKKGARFYATFYGSEVRWIGTAADTYGRARVSIDGGPPQEITLTSATTSYQKTHFTKAGLGQDRAHTIMIEALGSGSGGSEGLTAVDAIVVRGGWLLSAAIPAVTINEADASVAWKGTWATTKSTRFSSGTHKWASRSGASAKLTFEGTSATWIDKRASQYGKSDVYLDGKRVATVDQYAANSAWGQELWKSGRLSSGRHTLEIRALGTKRAASRGTVVGVDSFKVTGRAIRP